ncbi:uncharacterized protein KQ657_003131 [Scheffersomyces spartinae]|uniref:Histone H1 n=1 Tax=Scheffersomyces spartinae TaxID=45513 RepID=A0A9P8AGJ2_9ASCO|nr:uncharacterized protein KQ657_003131 [Scheffersomyces spartinae]KAG7191455.1 hypothetical protein KQ657_003131 [Scheffersomyces spartinae]
MSAAVAKGSKSGPTVAASKLTIKDMIKSALVTLKERNGSSRQSLKKYVQSNYDIKSKNFDSLFNTAIRKGLETGEFNQPKGPSGPVKLVKKLSAPAATESDKVSKPKKAAPPKKAAVEKAVAAKKASTEKPTTKKATTEKAAPKKATATASKKATTSKTTASKAAPKKVTKKAAAPVKKATTTTKKAPAKKTGTTAKKAAAPKKSTTTKKTAKK